MDPTKGTWTGTRTGTGTGFGTATEIETGKWIRVKTHHTTGQKSTGLDKTGQDWTRLEWHRNAQGKLEENYYLVEEKNLFWTFIQLFIYVWHVGWTFQAGLQSRISLRLASCCLRASICSRKILFWRRRSYTWKTSGKLEAAATGSSTDGWRGNKQIILYLSKQNRCFYELWQ